MEKNTEELQNDQVTDISICLPELNNDIKKKVNLAINHDGSEVTTIYLSNFIERFGKYFNNILLVSEEDLNIESINIYNNVSVIPTLKHSEFTSEWMMLLEANEFPSIQLLENFEKILTEINQKTFVIKLPVVVCNFQNGDILEVLPPTSRLLKRNPQLLNSDTDELVLIDYPIIRLQADSEQITSES